MPRIGAASLWLLLIALVAGQTRSMAAEPASPPKALPPVVEVDDLVLPAAILSTFDPDEVPAAVRELDGRRVRIYGYVYPLSTGEPVPQVLILGATQGRAKHFTNPAEIHHKLAVTLTSPMSFQGSESVLIEGVFRVKPRLRGTELLLLFFVDEASAIPAKPREGFHSPMGFGC